MIVKRSIPFRDTFQLVIEIDYDLTQRHIIMDLHTITGNIFLLKQYATFTQSVMIGPMKVVLVMTEARIYGSSIWSISVGSGKPLGLCTSVQTPFLS